MGPHEHARDAQGTLAMELQIDSSVPYRVVSHHSRDRRTFSMSSPTRLLAATSIAASCMLLLPACSPPKGEPTGRAPSTDTTPAERRSPQVSITGLTEQSDLVAEQLMADLNTIPELNGSYRSTIVFGDIMNKTGIVPTSDFEAFRTKIRGRLHQSQALRAKVRFVESRAKVEELRRREGAGGTDLLQQGRDHRAPVPDAARRRGFELLEQCYIFFSNMRRTDGIFGREGLYRATLQRLKLVIGNIACDR